MVGSRAQRDRDKFSKVGGSFKKGSRGLLKPFKPPLPPRERDTSAIGSFATDSNPASSSVEPHTFQETLAASSSLTSTIDESKTEGTTNKSTNVAFGDRER